MEDGQQAKYNHEDCPAGTDTKQRLYVKYLGGSYLIHCHHCGESAYYRPRETYSRIVEAKSHVISLEPTGSPTFSELESTEMPMEAELWLARYGFTKEMQDAYNIKYVKYPEQGVALPCFGDTWGYQIRTFGNSKVKYKTYRSPRFSHLIGTMGAPRSLMPVIVVVEDLLSHYKLAHAGMHTLCILGTSVSPDALDILKKYGRVVLWLDDDSAGHSAMLKITRELSGVLKNITSVILKQPKELSIEELRGVDL